MLSCGNSIRGPNTMAAGVIRWSNKRRHFGPSLNAVFCCANEKLTGPSCCRTSCLERESALSAARIAHIISERESALPVSMRMACCACGGTVSRHLIVLTKHVSLSVSLSHRYAMRTLVARARVCIYICYADSNLASHELFHY